MGAATARVPSLAIDRPLTDAAFWAYLVAEVGFGTIALGQLAISSRRGVRRKVDHDRVA